MNLLRRKLAMALMATCAAFGLPQAATAQSKPLTIIVPYPAGGSTDVIARLLAEDLKHKLKRTVVVENRGGGGGRVGLIALKNAPRDGSYVLLGLTSMVITSIVFETGSNFDFGKDFVGVAKVGQVPMALAVSPQNKAGNFKEFLDGYKTDKVFAYGTNGPASFSHLSGLRLAAATGLEANPIAYQGGAPMANDLMGGQIDAAIDTISDYVERHRAGKIKVLATFGKNRTDIMPEIPTLNELGVTDVESELWYGVVAGSGENPAFVKEVQEAVRASLQEPAIQAKLNKLMQIEFADSQALTDTIAQDFKTWTPIIEKAGLKNK